MYIKKVYTKENNIKKKNIIMIMGDGVVKNGWCNDGIYLYIVVYRGMSI